MQILRNFGFGNTRSTRTLFMFAGIVVLAPVCIAVLFFLGRLVGKAMFAAEKDGAGYNRLSKVLYITASAIVGVSGIILIPFNSVYFRRYKITVYRKLLVFMKAYGVSRFTKGMPLLWGIVMILISVTCIVLICTKIPFYKDLKSKLSAKAGTSTEASGNSVLSIIGIILSALGNLGTWITAFVGILFWRKVYFFNGYAYTKVLCTLFLILMLTGIVFLIIGLISLPAQKKAARRITLLIFTIILLVSSAVNSIWLILNAMQYAFRL